jgi:shikimate 5-dehydrogenase
MNGYMGFIGVSTEQSSIMSIFPVWAKILDLPTRTLIGHDLPIGATAQEYVRLVEQIRDDPHHVGALVTTPQNGPLRGHQQPVRRTRRLQCPVR